MLTTALFWFALGCKPRLRQYWPLRPKARLGGLFWTPNGNWLVLHLIKLCVGCDTVEELLAWRAAIARPGEPWILRTRQSPKRAAELMDGGSLYRVYRGFILSRQKLLSINTLSSEGRPRCEITLDDAVILTDPTPRRAFQGWRYLPATDAPRDLGEAGAGQEVPVDLARRLREIGAW